MSNYSIEIRNLCIDYKPLKNLPSIKNFFKEKHESSKVVHAVKNVTFDVANGEILGIIGQNGSGKSTLLKAIAGIFQPDSGTIDLNGNSVSLMSLGVGFNPDVSGRKNIVLSGMLLGFSEDEMKKKTDKIIEFSELEDFADLPVRTYSSGMYSKLAFSITANVETNIMLIDEVLSVGDERFKKKSLNKMKELITDNTKTVIIVSHDIPTLSELCDRVAWMENGEIREIGDSQEILKRYADYMRN